MSLYADNTSDSIHYLPLMSDAGPQRLLFVYTLLPHWSTGLCAKPPTCPARHRMGHPPQHEDGSGGLMMQVSRKVTMRDVVAIRCYCTVGSHEAQCSTSKEIGR